MDNASDCKRLVWIARDQQRLLETSIDCYRSVSVTSLPAETARDRHRQRYIEADTAHARDQRPNENTGYC